jgi:Rrf2 family transcriptional regulator, cysteine metabolism repressor
MKISTKGCYGLRALVDLAQHQGAGPVLMQAIADRQGVSRKYLHALLSSLRAAGLVRSVRGSGGGYVLARAPGEIGVHDILQALEGNLDVSECARHPGRCERSATCANHDIWAELSRALASWLAGLTLADLVARQAEKTRTHVAAGLMFDI